MTGAARLGMAGFALIAVCYGLARFAFGLFLPEIRADLGLSSGLGGMIAGGSFLGYCIAIALSAGLTERFGPRIVAVLAGTVATLGLAAMFLSSNAATLAGAVLFAGLSTGLASPPMAAAVATTIDPSRRDGTNTLINAGTSAGVAICGLIALFFGADWRAVYVLFCGLALVTTVAALLTVPGSSPGGAAARVALPRFSPRLRKLVSAAFLTGTISTTVWSFGGELTARALAWTSGDIGILWIVIGIAGGGGAFAGRLVARFGINRVHRTALVGLIFGVLCVGHPHTTATLALLGAALFGASYIMLTGVYLVWGTAVLPERPATGLTIAFLAFAVGQTVGAPVFAWLLEAASPLKAILVFAALGVVPAAIGYGPGRKEARSRPASKAC